MGLGDVVGRMVAFVRASYPRGVPATDYVRLLALLRRRLSDDEVVAVASELVRHGTMPIDGTDIRVAINKITDEMPSPVDTDRVRRRLEEAGWRVSGDFDTAG
jgi:Protein of unknown function (DUF3349)